MLLEHPRTAAKEPSQCKPDAFVLCRKQALVSAQKTRLTANFPQNLRNFLDPILDTLGQMRASPLRCAKPLAHSGIGCPPSFLGCPAFSYTGPIPMPATTDHIIFTDLDGSLLDADSYSYEAASGALGRVADSQTALILVSSKTRAEMEPLRDRLRLRTPFIVENGGAIFIPIAYFPFSAEGSFSCGPYRVIEIGVPYADLRVALKAISGDVAARLKGFGDMTVEEVAESTGLSPADAQLAKRREYDEPFLVAGNGLTLRQLQGTAEAKGLRCTKGGRFFHLMGHNDKGRATLRLIELYRRLARDRGHAIVTIGIGDSLNDLPMLQVVDRPVLVQKPGGGYDPDIELPGLIRAPGIGPAGWNHAVLDLLSSD